MGFFGPITNHDNNVAGENNTSGPYYDSGYAYYFYATLAPGNILNFRTVRCTTGSDWAASGDGTFSGVSNINGGPLYMSFAEYQSGPTHVVYAIFAGTDLTGTGRVVLLYQYDFATNSWTFLDNVGPPNIFPDPYSIAIADNGDEYNTGNYVLPTPDLRPFLRCDQATGVLYCAYTSAGLILNTCMGSGGDYTDVYVGYSTYSGGVGGTWAGYTVLATAVAGGTIGPAQVWIQNSVLCMIYQTFGLDGIGLLGSPATPCNNHLGNSYRDRTTVFDIVRSDGGSFSGSVNYQPYGFNAPGCFPYADNDLVATAGANGAYTDSSYVYQFQGVGGMFSLPVEFGGAWYMAGISSTHKLQVFKFTMSAVSLVATTHDISVGIEGSNGIYYNNWAQFVVVNNRLVLMWKSLPTGLKSYEFIGNLACTGDVAYVPANPCRTPDVYFAEVSTSGVVGTPRRMPVKNIGPDPHGGETAMTGGVGSLMPLIIPATGTYYRAGDLTYVVNNLFVTHPAGSMGIPLDTQFPRTPGASGGVFLPRFERGPIN